MAAPVKDAGKEAAKDAVTETANSTAQQAASGGGTPEILSFIAGSPILIIIGLFSIIAVALVAAIIYFGVKDAEEEEFEKESLETIIKPEFKKVVKEQGRKNGSSIRRDLRKEGEIYKDVRFTENDNLIEHMESLEKENDDFSLDLNLSYPDDEEKEKQLENWHRQGIYDQRELTMIDDSNLVPHRLMWIRPHKLIDKVIWLVTDIFMGRDWMSSYRLIPEHRIVDNPGDNSVSIDRNMQLRPFAGVELPLYFESISMLHAVVSRRLYETALEDQVNYSEKVNFFDSKFSQRIQELEAEAEIEDQKYSSDVAGDVNQS